jgi:protein involved in polysaccharide export with SLBB domain
MKRSFFILLIFCFILADSSVSGQIVSPDKTPTEFDPEKDLIHFGDLIDVDILGGVEYDWRGTLTPEGFLSGLDFIEEPVFARCKTETEVAEAVARGYSKLLRDPKVVVRIIDRSKRPVSTVFGAVKKEQRFQIQRPVFLNELIILSGGLTDRASGEIQIFRPKEVSCVEMYRNQQNTDGDEEREKFVRTSQENGSNLLNIKISDLLRGKENPQIFSGDIITILESDPIYIIGGVAAPKRISSRTRTTLSRAIAAAGGFSKDAEPEKITIFRRENNETKIIQANFKEIEKNADKDIQLQPFDVVDVGVKGRGKSKLAPVVREEDFSAKNGANLPLRIID